jgi:hypothetical protein
MPAKLTEKEKAVRGTAQRCRARKTRTLRVIRREIRELRRLMLDMAFNVELARKSLRADGFLIEMLVANSHGKHEKTRRLNPAFKIQNDALKALKSLNRQMTILCEEHDAAEAAQQKAEEASEFRIED